MAHHGFCAIGGGGGGAAAAADVAASKDASKLLAGRRSAPGEEIIPNVACKVDHESSTDTSSRVQAIGVDASLIAEIEDNSTCEPTGDGRVGGILNSICPKETGVGGCGAGGSPSSGSRAVKVGLAATGAIGSVGGGTTTGKFSGAWYVGTVG